jgi:RNA polymerase sigma factor (sigma-70 family)
MSVEGSFADFIRRIRAGDAEAAAELVQRYEPAIRMEARLRLTDPRLYRLLDSMDICQSVLGSFFLRAASGQYSLDSPEQLLKLLVAIARKKVAFQARRQAAQRRDYRREVAIGPASRDVAASEPSASRQLDGQELLREFYRRLSEDERRMADLRAQGREWAEVAAQVGGTPQARRKQLARAVDRIALQLGLDEPHDG